jgi:predicted nucleotidyltransferase
MSALVELEKKCRASWTNIHETRSDAQVYLDKFRDLVAQEKTESQDISVVVFGSLARREWTSKSDLDWTLLIDGPVDSKHASEANQLASRVKEAGFKQPGPTALFGRLAFSHTLVHEIGGQDDSNRNLTQRLLLLLEACGIERDDAHRRVLEGILYRYLTNDPRAGSPRTVPLRVPRFLLNDVVRYWRTMCVDYANKYRDRAGDGWPIRHLKLRLSRKLIFTAGLILCFSCDCELFPEIAGKFRDLFSSEKSGQVPVKELVNYLRQLSSRNPLDGLAETCARFGTPETASLLFDAYNDFLGILRDTKVREHLGNLSPDTAENDSQFQRTRSIGQRFNQGLVKLFFQDHPRLGELTMLYGVF